MIAENKANVSVEIMFNDILLIDTLSELLPIIENMVIDRMTVVVGNRWFIVYDETPEKCHISDSIGVNFDDFMGKKFKVLHKEFLKKGYKIKKDEDGDLVIRKMMGCINIKGIKGVEYGKIHGFWVVFKDSLNNELRLRVNVKNRYRVADRNELKIRKYYKGIIGYLVISGEGFRQVYTEEDYSD